MTFMFESILGNEPIKAYLRKAVAEERLPHALLFTGPDGVGKSLFAKDLAIHLLGSGARVAAENHPDFHVLRPGGKSGQHPIETLRGLIDDVHATPFEAKAKVFLIHDAHRMQPAAANALLKTLEEPSPDTVLILLTSAPQEILPTIASRCSLLRFQLLSETEIGSLLTAKGLQGHFARRAHGSAGKAFDLAIRAPVEDKLFRLLSEKMSYPERSLALEEIEKDIENEDPVKHAADVEHIFAAALMWHRDAAARSCGAPLFFPDAPKPKWPLPPLAEIERIVDEARLAVSRNIRLSVCLEQIFPI
jgi:DNA polymerase-3 subunit delta'